MVPQTPRKQSNKPPIGPLMPLEETRRAAVERKIRGPQNDFIGIYAKAGRGCAEIAH